VRRPPRSGCNEYRKGADIFVPACTAAGWLPVCAGNPIPGAVNLGRLDSESLALAYNTCDAVIFASRYKAASLALLEALACGAMPLVSNVVSVGTLLRRAPEFSDCLIEVNQRVVAEKLGQVAADPDRFRRSAAAVSNVVRTYYSLRKVEQSRWLRVRGRS
jgi:glycosyltransferase involved in cell wall biosynthesis